MIARFACAVAAAAGLLLVAAPLRAAEDQDEAAPIGYGGAIVQMLPLMAPYHAGGGVRYEALTIRLVLDQGPRERPACFSVPYLHDRFLAYVYQS